MRAALAWTGKDTSPFNTSAGLFYKNNRTYQLPEGGQISLPEFNSSTLANLNLKNELTRSIEFGLNMSFLKSRLDLDVSYYKTIQLIRFFPCPYLLNPGYNPNKLMLGIFKMKA